MVFRLSRKHAVAIPARSQLSPSSLCSEPARAELLCERARASCRRRDQLGEQHTDRVAISNARLVIADDQAVVFRTRGADTATVSPSEFIGRFLLHILPSHFDPTLPRPALLLALTGIDALLCPRCQHRTLVREALPLARCNCTTKCLQCPDS